MKISTSSQQLNTICRYTLHPKPSPVGLQLDVAGLSERLEWTDYCGKITSHKHKSDIDTAVIPLNHLRRGNGEGDGTKEKAEGG